MIYVLLVGLIAGAVAGAIVRGKGYGCIVNIILGIIGAYLGNWLLDELGIYIHDGILGTIITAVIGAVAFLLIVNIIQKAFK